MTKHIGTGLLALAATASIAMAHGKNGEAKNGGESEPKGPSFLQGLTINEPGSGVTMDGGDKFSLTLQNTVQTQWTYASRENAANTNSFNVRRARTNLFGHIFDRNVTYRLVMDWADTGNEDPAGSVLKDAWIHWNFMNDGDNKLGVRFGQGKTYFGRSATGSFMFLEFIERDIATRALADARSRGAAIHGQHLEGGKLRWTAGFWNGSTAAGSAFYVSEERPNDDNELNLVASVNFDPMGDITEGAGDQFYQQADLRDVNANDQLLLSFGAGVEVANAAGGAAGDVEGTNININAAAKISGFHALGEVFLRSDDPQNGTEEDTTGFNIQGSYTIPAAQGSETRWGGALRVTQLSVDDAPVVGITGSPLGAASGDIFEIGFGVNAFYHKHFMKTQLNYTFQQVEPDGAADRDNHIIDVMFTLIF